MAKKRKKTLTDQLRRIIENHEFSRYRISKETGIDASQLLRFMKQKGQIGSDNLDRIGALLNLEIRIKK